MLVTKLTLILFIILFTIINTSWNYYSTNKKTSDKIPAKSTTTVTASFIGDLLYEQPYYDWLGSNYENKGYYDLVKPYFLNDDLTLANMEVPIGGSELGISGKGYSFNAPIQIGQEVIDMGVDALNLANNHANDAGIGYTYKTNKLDYQNQNLIGYYRNLDTMKLDDEHKDIIKNEVKQAKQISDVVIVSMHWGNEFTYTVNDEQKELANYLNELGVDIIIGHHSHCIQPIEWLENNDHKTLVAYSLGSFVSADNQVTRATNEFANAYNISMILQTEFEKKEHKTSIKKVTYTPIINYYDQNFENFKLVPLNLYDEELETSHDRYSKGLNKDFIINSFNNVIDQQFNINYIK